MFSLEDLSGRDRNLRPSVSSHPEHTRREWLRIGGLSTLGLTSLGLTLPQLLALEQARGATGPANPAPTLAKGLGGSTFGRAKSVIYLWLQGGPPQHETFDPKPDAPVEIRGPFKPIATNVPGIQISELLPRTARIADKLAIVRSLHTNDNNHDVSGYWVLTGYPYGPGSARQIKPVDWPYFGSLVKMLKPSTEVPALSSVWIPDMMRLNDGVTPAGQTAGFLGKQWEPERFVGDPALDDYKVDGLSLQPDLTRLRVDRRRDLLKQLEARFAQFERSGGMASWNNISQQAFDLVTSGRAKAAFDLSQESDATRDRYGRHSWGQTVLLARRLVEAGVRLVHVNWTREAGDSAVDNPMWDTHSKNADRLQDCLCPQFDVGFTALMEDLEQRGLLEETLVVVIGEFGRTPKINARGGRDHWGNVFSFALAGAGISGGQVFGASDKNGGNPTVDPIRPHDLTATIFHLLGVDPHGMFHDLNDRPHPITKGNELHRLLGNAPATADRCPAGGDLAFVPPFDARLLLDADFTENLPLVGASTAGRDKGWRAKPIREAAERGVLAVEKVAGDPVVGEKPHVRIGFEACDGVAVLPIKQGAKAVFGQEIRNARGGHYTFTIEAAGMAVSNNTVSNNTASQEWFEQVFAANFTCRLVLQRYRTMAKDPTDAEELAAEAFVPEFAPLAPAPRGEEAGVRGDSQADGKLQSFTVSKFLGSTTPNVNFAIGNGLGVAVIVEKTSPGELSAPGEGVREAYLRIGGVKLTFSARQRDDSVTT